MLLYLAILLMISGPLFKLQEEGACDIFDRQHSHDAWAATKQQDSNEIDTWILKRAACSAMPTPS